MSCVASLSIQLTDSLDEFLLIAMCQFLDKRTDFASLNLDNNRREGGLKKMKETIIIG